MDQVDVALEGLGRTDGQLEWRDLLAERRTQRVQGDGRIRVFPVALVDKEARRGAGRSSQRHGVFEARLHPAGGIHHEERPVGCGEPFDHVRDEVRIAGRVDQRDPRPVCLERPDGQAQRRLALLLLGLEVEMGGAVIHPPQARDGAGLEQQLLSQCRLARARVARQDHAAKMREVDILHRHRVRRSFLVMGDSGRPWCGVGP